MNKPTFLVCFLGTLLSSTSAQAFWPKTWQDNWLIGASFGIAERDGGLRSGVSYSLPNTIPAIVALDYTDKGPIWGLFVGHQATCDEWLMGLEFNVDWEDIDKDHFFAFSDPQNLVGWNASVRYQQGLIASLSGRVGYAIVPYFMPYLRLGVEVSRDKLTSEFVPEPGAYPYSIGFNTKTWVYRFLSGIGFEMPIPCTPTTVRFEYNFHSKGKTLESSGLIGDNLLDPLFVSDLQPMTQTYRVSFVWNFR